MPKPPQTPAQLWLDELTGGDSQLQAATRAKISQTTLNRRLASGRLTADQVIQLCRAYGRPPAQGLYETGLLHAAELDAPSPGLILPNIHTRELLNELTKRVLGDQLLAHSNAANQQDTGATVEHMDDYRPLAVHNDPYSVEYDEKRHVALSGDELEPNELQEP